MTKKEYQMFWDCAYCGTKELLGVSHRHCPNCGGAQDENRRYFPPAGKEVELKNHKYYGIDWDCQHCSTPNSKASHNCVNCGSPQDGAVEVDLVGRSKVKKKPQTNTSEIRNNEDSVQQSLSTLSSLKSDLEPSTEKYLRDDVSGNKGFNAIMVIMGLVFALFIGFFIYGHFKVTEHQVAVVEKTWKRSIDVEEYRKVRDSDWCSSMPSDAYSVSSSREVRSHKQVPDGQTCSTHRSDRGDGSYTTERICETKYRSEPVYDNRCSYSVNRWRFSNSVLSQGSGYSVPQDPDVRHINVNNRNVLGNKRLGSRSESYTVHFQYEDDGEREKTNCFYPQNKWELFKFQNKYLGKVRMIGGLICHEVIPNNNNHESWSLK